MSDQSEEMLLNYIAEHLSIELLQLTIELGFDVNYYNQLCANYSNVVTRNRQALQDFTARCQSSDSRKILETALGNIGRNDLMLAVHRHPRNQAHGTPHSGVVPLVVPQSAQFSEPVQQRSFPLPNPPPATQNVPFIQEPVCEILTNIHILELSQRLANEYSRLGTYLGISYDQMQVYERDYRRTQDRIFHILSDWVKGNQPANLEREQELQERLKMALSRTGRNDLAMTVQSWRVPTPAPYAGAHDRPHGQPANPTPAATARDSRQGTDVLDNVGRSTQVTNPSNSFFDGSLNRDRSCSVHSSGGNSESSSQSSSRKEPNFGYSSMATVPSVNLRQDSFEPKFSLVSQPVESESQRHERDPQPVLTSIAVDLAHRSMASTEQPWQSPVPQTTERFSHMHVQDDYYGN